MKNKVFNEDTVINNNNYIILAGKSKLSYEWETGKDNEFISYEQAKKDNLVYYLQYNIYYYYNIKNKLIDKFLLILLTV